ncbi:globin [Photobacterium sanctipauli]|uniref:Globin n=1 Tax=Photobacterium sanctipauli TaxID=1342794 RepID=A0A2T3P064_9GAMM|nr:globin [Photobacterium sanctipauli]PSW21897.1 globin [Photobacterium sanctipauli]
MDFHEQFNDSYERCLRHSNFFEVFYDLFFKRDEKFRQMFDGVDMQKQIKMIKASIVMILLASTSEQARESIRVFGQRHGPKGIGVNPVDFDIWLECLLEAVSMCDPRYNEAVKQAWTTCFKEGIAIMKEECSS